MHRALATPVRRRPPLPLRRLPVIPGYRLHRILGRGSTAAVYLATRGELPVALKLVSRPEARLRLRAEVEVLQRLRHPQIVALHDAGAHGAYEYAALELVPGGDLRRRARGVEQSAEFSAKLVSALATALQTVHDAGLVHRDVTPANVLLTTEGAPKIADFGGTGTPDYLAPEQTVPDGVVGPAADVYALGVLLYELLTGRGPFRGSSFATLTDQIRHAPAVPPARLRPSIPRALDAITSTCLEKDPRRRFPSAAALADALAPLGSPR